MPQQRLSMRKIEEILGLKYEAGLSHRVMAQSCDISPSTVSEYLTRAQAANICWPLPEGLSAAELDERLFPQANTKIALFWPFSVLAEGPWLKHETAVIPVKAEVDDAHATQERRPFARADDDFIVSWLCS